MANLARMKRADLIELARGLQTEIEQLKTDNERSETVSEQNEMNCLKSEIERLELVNKHLRKKNKQLDTEVSRLQTEYVQLANENEWLKTKNEQLNKKAMRGGRHSKLDDEQVKKVKKLRQQGMSMQKIANQFGVAKATIFNALKDKEN